MNVLALQRMLGHKSAKVTLDTYADLFDDDLDAVAVSLRARYSTRGNCVSPKLPASCGQNAATGLASKHETPIYQGMYCYRMSAGGGIRTLTLSRAPAPKAGMSAVPSRPRAQKSYRRPCLRRPRWSLAPSPPGSTF